MPYLPLPRPPAAVSVSDDMWERGIPEWSPELSDNIRYVLVADPLDQFVHTDAQHLMKHDYRVLLLQQKKRGTTFDPRRGPWHVDAQPRSCRHGEQFLSNDQLMQRLPEFAEHAVAINQHFAAYTVFGVGIAGGIIAAEVAARFRMGMALLLRKPEARVDDDRMLSVMALESALRSADVIALSGAARSGDYIEYLHKLAPDKTGMLALVETGDHIVGLMNTLIARRPDAKLTPIGTWRNVWQPRTGNAPHRNALPWRLPATMMR